MQKRRVGKTALEVTEYGIGGAAIGGLYRAVDRATAEETLEAAWGAGLRLFDTAPFYGFGLSERRVGDVLRSKPAAEYVLSTKVGRLLRPVPRDQVPDHSYVEPLDFTVEYDYSYSGIMRSVEMSFARLGLNRIDILYAHDIGAFTHGEEANRHHLRALLDSGLKALEELKSSGVIKAYGLGVNETAVCCDVLERAPLDVILLAGRYTLLDRSADVRLMDLCRRNGTSIIAGGVYNSGILATGPVPGANFNYGPAPQEVLDKVRALDAVSAANGVPAAAAAIRFPLRNPQVASILIGSPRRQELERNLALLQVPVPEAAWDSYSQHTVNGG